MYDNPYRAKQVSDLLRKNLPNVREELEGLGFEWIDDGPVARLEKKEKFGKPLKVINCYLAV